MKLETYLLGVLTSAFVVVCGCGSLQEESAPTRAELLRAKFDSADTNYVFVALHRGDWRNHPENSLSGIKGAIAMGGDIVEIDVSKTKDGHFVLSHDGKLDRTTDKKGKISDLTLAEVRQARLRMNQGGKNAELTDERVPTLEEALEACRGQILVNIDKFHVDREGMTAIIKKLGVARQVILKGGGDYEFVKKNTGAPWQYVEDRTFIYMPIVGTGKNAKALAKSEAIVAGWQKAPYAPPAYEVCITTEPPLAMFAGLKADPNHPRIWINTLWDSLAHGHSESLKGDDFSADKVWGWCLGLGCTMIQTDRPADCIAYLNSLGRHTL